MGRTTRNSMAAVAIPMTGKREMAMIKRLRDWKNWRKKIESIRTERMMKMDYSITLTIASKSSQSQARRTTLKPTTPGNRNLRWRSRTRITSKCFSQTWLKCSISTSSSLYLSSSWRLCPTTAKSLSNLTLQCLFCSFLRQYWQLDTDL